MDLGRGAHRAHRVVAVRDRCAEHRHHRIADVLVDAAAEALDDLVGRLVEPLEHRVDVLRVERARHPRVVDEIGEDHGHRSPFAVALLARSPGRRRSRGCRSRKHRGSVSATAPASASRVPQPPQNFSAASFAKPHAGQATGRLAPHCAQNRRPAPIVGAAAGAVEGSMAWRRFCPARRNTANRRADAVAAFASPPTGVLRFRLRPATHRIPIGARPSPRYGTSGSSRKSWGRSARAFRVTTTCVRDLESFVRTADDPQVVRIDPIPFAAARGIGEEDAIDLFLHGRKAGLFSMEWQCVCPGCGEIAQSFRIAAFGQGALLLQGVHRRARRGPERFHRDHVHVVARRCGESRYHDPASLDAESYALDYRFTANGVVDGGPSLRDFYRKSAVLTAFVEPGETKSFPLQLGPGFLFFTSGPVVEVRTELDAAQPSRRFHARRQRVGGAGIGGRSRPARIRLHQSFGEASPAARNQCARPLPDQARSATSRERACCRTRRSSTSSRPRPSFPPKASA